MVTESIRSRVRVRFRRFGWQVDGDQRRAETDHHGDSEDESQSVGEDGNEPRRRCVRTEQKPLDVADVGDAGDRREPAPHAGVQHDPEDGDPDRSAEVPEELLGGSRQPHPLGPEVVLDRDQQCRSEHPHPDTRDEDRHHHQPQRRADGPEHRTGEAHGHQRRAGRGQSPLAEPIDEATGDETRARPADGDREDDERRSPRPTPERLEKEGIVRERGEHRKAREESRDVGDHVGGIVEQRQRDDRDDRSPLRKDEPAEARETENQQSDGKRRLGVEGFERDEDGPDADREGHGPGIVDVSFGITRGLFERAGGHDHGEDPDRDAEVEHPAPREGRDDDVAEERADDARHSPDGAAIPDRAAALLGRVDHAEDRIRDREHRAGTDPLERAKRDELNHGLGRAGERAAEHEQRYADEEQALSAVDIREPPEQRHRNCSEQHVGSEHPRVEGEAAERGDDGGHRGADDGTVDPGEEDTEHHPECHELPVGGGSGHGGMRS